MRGNLITGQQLKAARALVGIGQVQLAEAVGLHVNSVRYLERQDRITTIYSRQCVETAMNALGVIFLSKPTPGVRVAPSK